MFTEVCFLRGLETLELYRAQNELTFVAEYKMSNLKVRDMNKFRVPWLEKDIICVQIQTLRFICLVFDSDLIEWRTLCLFNFD